MKDMNAYINVSLTGNQATAVQAVIKTELMRNPGWTNSPSLMKWRLILDTVDKALDDALDRVPEAEYSESDATGTV